MPLPSSGIASELLQKLLNREQVHCVVGLVPSAVDSRHWPGRLVVVQRVVAEHQGFWICSKEYVDTDFGSNENGVDTIWTRGRRPAVPNPFDGPQQ